jgi:uncharacterized protein YjbJ (UPF0337 family)
MNNDTRNGKANEILGRAQREAGKITGSKKLQVKGSLREMEGKVQSAWGEAKDLASSAAKRARARSAQSGQAPRAVRVTRTTKTTVIRVRKT